MEQQDWRAALIAAQITNAVKAFSKRRGKAAKPEDFMPERRKLVAEVQTPEAQLTLVEMLNAAFGGQDLRQSGS